MQPTLDQFVSYSNWDNACRNIAYTFFSCHAKSFFVVISLSWCRDVYIDSESNYKMINKQFVCNMFGSFFLSTFNHQKVLVWEWRPQGGTLGLKPSETWTKSRINKLRTNKTIFYSEASSKNIFWPTIGIQFF